jgi:hypothetical protein
VSCMVNSALTKRLSFSKICKHNESVLILFLWPYTNRSIHKFKFWHRIWFRKAVGAKKTKTRVMTRRRKKSESQYWNMKELEMPYQNYFQAIRQAAWLFIPRYILLECVYIRNLQYTCTYIQLIQTRLSSKTLNHELWACKECCVTSIWGHKPRGFYIATMPKHIVNKEKYGAVIYWADLSTLTALKKRQSAFLARS